MSDINPYAPPLSLDEVVPATIIETAEEKQGLFRKGNQLVMHKLAVLPDRCVKSNEPAGGLRLRRNLSWIHPLIYLTVLLGVLVFVLLAIILRKHATIHVGLSRRWSRKRRWAIFTGWTTSLFGVAIGFVSSWSFLPPQGHAWAGWGILLGIVMILGGAIYGSLRAQMVWPVRITDNYLWLKGVHPDFLANLPEWPNRP